MRAAITDMWADAPGGWVFEWSRLGARYAEEGNEALATLAYGWARFPVLADDAKREALRHQVEHYLLAAEDFPVDFERRFLELPYQGSTDAPSRPRPRRTRSPRRRARPDRQRRRGLVEDGPPQPLRRLRPQRPCTRARVRHPGHRRVPDIAEPRLGGAGRLARRPRQGDGRRNRRPPRHLDGRLLLRRDRPRGHRRCGHRARRPRRGRLRRRAARSGSGWRTSSATRSASTTRRAPRRWPSAARECPCGRCSTRTRTHRCWWSTAPTTSTSPRRTRSSSATAATPGSSCCRTPGTAPCRSSPRWSRR